MQDDLEQEEISLLFDECRSRLGEVEEDLLGLVQGKITTSSEVVARIFRAFHSVKGSAGYLGNHPLQHLSHVAEDLLAEVRDGRIQLIPEYANVLLAASDRMKAQVSDDNSHPDIDDSRELAALNAILQAHRNIKPARRPQPAPQASLPSLKMLVVEDDFTARVALQGLLSRYGECHIAVNGREAVDAFRSAFQAGQGYDLICMDIRLPELDGTGAVRAIRAFEESQNMLSSGGVKIFMTTGILRIQSVSSSFRALCDAYLSKPIDGEELHDHLASFGLLNGPGTERLRTAPSQ